ncbi:MAG TPA: hypothetical protein DGH68_05310 [Bacteroidetes bacterium]|jgi:hypothetical protein|nr:hypothetical protein [Bacteroidota bacterium]
MKKIIVTTTINPPTEAIRKYDSMEDWQLIVVGDKKTPEYELERGIFLDWQYIQMSYPDLVDVIGFNSVRLGRMVAFIEAYRRGAIILASVDDDCIPCEGWGRNVYVGARIAASEWKTNGIAFDPHYPHGYKAWHRGYPFEVDRACVDTGMGVIEPLVQEDLCFGESDIDASLRLIRSKSFEPRVAGEYFSRAFSPINTQNTFIHRSVIKDFYANIPGIGRADDIWSGYIFQALHPNSTLYCFPSATHSQDRPMTSILHDLEEEIFMYKNTAEFIWLLQDKGVQVAMQTMLPPVALKAIAAYRRYFE